MTDRSYPETTELPKCDVCNGEGRVAYIQSAGGFSEPAGCYKCGGSGRGIQLAHGSAESEGAEFDWSLSNRLRADFLHGEIAVWNTLVEAADEIDRLNDAAQAVPVADLLAVVEIADRNEYAPQISRVKAWLSSLTSPHHEASK